MRHGEENIKDLELEEFLSMIGQVIAVINTS